MKKQVGAPPQERPCKKAACNDSFQKNVSEKLFGRRGPDTARYGSRAGGFLWGSVCFLVPHQMLAQDYDEMYKIVLVGDPGVGKTNLLAYYTADPAVRAVL